MQCEFTYYYTSFLTSCTENMRSIKLPPISQTILWEGPEFVYSTFAIQKLPKTFLMRHWMQLKHKRHLNGNFGFQNGRYQESEIHLLWSFTCWRLYDSSTTITISFHVMFRIAKESKRNVKEITQVQGSQSTRLPICCICSLGNCMGMHYQHRVRSTVLRNQTPGLKRDK